MIEQVAVSELGGSMRLASVPCRQAAARPVVIRTNAPAVAPVGKPEPFGPFESRDLTRILLLLHARTTHGFARYKQSTILRGIHVRMLRNGVENTSAYAHFLEDTPEEPLLLFAELLIHVTRFFRDPEAFALLRRATLPQLLRDQPIGRIFRAWVPGCATGEEAYSLAMLLQEASEVSDQACAFEVSGTDIDPGVLASAVAGVFPMSIARDVLPARRRRFFTREPAGYQVADSLRDTVVFHLENVDAPRAPGSLDLISCRNLLIYLQPDLQDALISAFHRALRPGGVLLLSPSESIGSGTDLFTPISRKWKLYRANSLGPAAAYSQPGIAQA